MAIKTTIAVKKQKPAVKKPKSLPAGKAIKQRNCKVK